MPTADQKLIEAHYDALARYLDPEEHDMWDMLRHRIVRRYGWDAYCRMGEMYNAAACRDFEIMFLCRRMRDSIPAARATVRGALHDALRHLQAWHGTSFTDRTSHNGC